MPPATRRASPPKKARPAPAKLRDDDDDDDDDDDEEEYEDEEEEEVAKKKKKAPKQTKSAKTKKTKGKAKAQKDTPAEEKADKDISDDETPLWDDPEEEEDDEEDNAFVRQFKQIMAGKTPTATQKAAPKKRPPARRIEEEEESSSSSSSHHSEEEEEEEEAPAKETTPMVDTRWQELEDAQRKLVDSVRAQSDHLTDLSSRNDAFIQKGSERLAQIQSALFDLAQNVRELHAHLEAHDKSMQASTQKLLSAQKLSHSMLKDHALMLTKTFARVTNIKQTLLNNDRSSTEPAEPPPPQTQDPSDTLLKAANAFASNAYSRLGPLLQPTTPKDGANGKRSKGVSLKEARGRLRRSPSPPPATIIAPPADTGALQSEKAAPPRSVSPAKKAKQTRSVSPAKKKAAKPRSVSPAKKKAAKPRSVSPAPKKAAKPRSVSPPTQHRYATRSRSPPKANAKTAFAFEAPYYPSAYTPPLSSSSAADIEALIDHLNALDPPNHHDIDALWAQLPAFDAVVRLPSKEEVPDAVQRVSILLERLSSRLASEYPPTFARAAYSPGFPSDGEEEEDSG